MRRPSVTQFGIVFEYPTELPGPRTYGAETIPRMAKKNKKHKMGVAKRNHETQLTTATRRLPTAH
jgi:hypothetical protein